MKIRINMLSKADSVPGQGVGSAYKEQVNLIKDIDNFEVAINSKKSNFDIYHIHSVNPSFKLRMNKKHLNVMYVHFIPKKNHESIKLPKICEKIFDHYVESFYRKADEIVVVNPTFKKDLQDLGIDDNKITYIPNYVDNRSFFKMDEDKKKLLKEKYNIPLNRFVVLGCGQIQTRKGIDDFIETAKKNPDMIFIWVGGFPFGRIMHGYKKYHKMFKELPSNMIHIEILDRLFMNEILNCADVFFMPSYMELFPMTILEASNINLPILVRDLELYRPILFSKYVKGNNVDEFSFQLQRLKDDITYYNEQSNNSKFISEFYNRNALKNTWKEYYERVFIKWKNNHK